MRNPARGRARLGIAGVGTRASSPSSDRANCSAAAKMPIPKTIPGLRRRLAFIFGGHELELPCEAVDHEVLAGAVEASVQEGGYHQEESENQCCPSAHLWLLLCVPGTQPSTYDSPSCGVNECAAAPVSGTVPTAADGEAATCRRAESDDKLPHPVLRQNSGCPLPPLVLQAGHVDEVSTRDERIARVDRLSRGKRRRDPLRRHRSSRGDTGRAAPGQ